MARATFLTRLVAALVLVNFLILLMAAVSLFQSREQAYAKAATQAQGLAQVLEQTLSGIVRRIDLTLLNTAEEMQAQLADGVDETTINAYIRRQFEHHAELDSLRVANADGWIVYGVGVSPGGAINMADRDFFVEARDNPASGLLISRPMVGRISGKWVVALTRRINRPDGSFGGIAYAVIAIERLQRLFQAADVGPQGAVVFRNLDFEMIARHPDSGGPVGQPLNRAISAEFADAVRRNPEVGTFTGAVAPEFTDRVLAYRRVSHYPGYLLVGVAAKDFLDEWRHNARRVGLLVSLILIVTSGAARLLYVGWRRQNVAAAALAQSNTELARSEERLRAMFQLSPLGMTRNTLDGRFIESNQAMLDITGYSSEELSRLTYWDLTPEEYRAEDAARIEHLRSKRRVGPYEKEYIRRDGGRMPVRLSAMMFDGGDGEPYLWAIVEDITERRTAEAATLLAASVFHNTAEAIVITDSKAVILSVNPAFTQITGYAVDEILGRTPRLLKSEHHEAEFYDVMWRDLTSKGKWQGRIWNRRKDGEAFLAWQTITAVRDERGQVMRYVSVFNDMTEIHRKDEHIRHQAYHDALTGLPNRLLLQDRLEHAIEVARRDGRKVALMFIDLDRFKVVNDSLGHDVGDMLLIEITRRLTESLRRSDTIARLGGDEFVVVLSDFDGAGEVAEVAEKIIQRVSLPTTLKSHEVHIGASIGIALFPEDGDDVTQLMKTADTAMYRSKASGRNTFRFFDAEMDGAAVERLKLEAALRRALENEEFELYYQPKIDLASGGLAGCEALIRWNSPERGLVAPDLFIPLAEETGLIAGIGDWVLEHACGQMAEWRRRGLAPVKVAVNASARQFLDPGFATKISTTLAKHQIAPSLLEIELTESTVMADPERASMQFQQLRDIGVAVSVDDFGTGYSSLAYLKRLPLDTIKIDRSFIRQVDSEIDNAAIVKAIIGLGGALGMSTIAEGVETSEEEAHLLAAGCGSAQGYHYAKPLPADQFEAWMAANAAPE